MEEPLLAGPLMARILDLLVPGDPSSVALVPRELRALSWVSRRGADCKPMVSGLEHVRSSKEIPTFGYVCFNDCLVWENVHDFFFDRTLDDNVMGLTGRIRRESTREQGDE